MENRTPKPSLKHLGYDLLELNRLQLVTTLLTPFILVALYFIFALLGYWSLAILCTIALSFASYPSTSHDLVHENLRISKISNTLFLSAIELLCFRSGHSYQAVHLYHHQRFPHEDDVEGSASRMTWFRSLLEGFVFQFKIYQWAIRQAKQGQRKIIIIEGILVIVSISCSVYSLSNTLVFFIYMCLMIAGSWIIPFMTSFIVHTPQGQDELSQTRLFRGTFFAIVAMNHLFHLEHHLYPMVPHKNWPKLARRLNKYFEENKVRPVQIL